MPRTVWLATGLAWAASSIILLAGPLYRDPQAIVGWAAVIAYSAGWLLLAPSMIFASRLATARRAHLLGMGIASAAGLTGIANLVAVGLGVAGAGTWYAYGTLVATVLLVPFAYTFLRERATRLALLWLVLFVGIGFTPAGVGGLVVLVVFAALALRPESFLPSPPPPTPTPRTAGA